NLGTAPATSINVTDTLSPGVLVLNVSPGCSASAGTVVCNVGTLAPAQAATLTIVVAAFAGGPITSTATVSATQIDTSPANNTATSVTTVVASPLTVPGQIPSTTSEVFNVVRQSWTPTGAMGTPRAGTTLTLLGDGTVLVLGGIAVSANAPSTLSTGELF